MGRRPWCSSWLLALGALGAPFVPLSHAEAAVTAQVVPVSGGTLHVVGDDSPDVVTLRVGVGVNAFRIQVLDGTTVVGSFLRSGFTVIQVETQGGADTILLSRVNGEITEPALLIGGDGNDTITGGAGTDTLHGGGGDDRIIWNPGDGNDFIFGAEGTDTLEVNGSDAAERFTIGSDASNVLITRDVDGVMPPDVTLTAGYAERVTISMKGAGGYGAHTERATDAPATAWYFAEGSQGFFQTFVLLANPGAVSNDATITFLLEGGAPLVKNFTLPPTSRQTVDAASIPELANQSFGIVVGFTQPGVAERAMYFSTPGTPLFNAGHESAGVNAPSASWFLAEGATGSFFTTFVLLANPGASDAIATVTFLPATGQPVTKTHRVDAGRRVTLNIAAEDPSLADGAVATQVVSTQPILVERAQYWPSTPDRWYEAHNSFGGTALAPRWGLAEGRVGGPEGYQTYILLANASLTQAADVTITFMRGDGTTVTKAFTVSPASRFNVHVNGMAPELVDESFGAVIQVTNGPGIFVERALYSDSSGVPFAAGTNALATRWP